METITIQVGKFSRKVEVSFFIGCRDTRWDVYPTNTQEQIIYVQPLKGGDVYRLDEKSGIWFKSIFPIIGKKLIDHSEICIDVNSAKIQIQALVNHID